MVKDKFYLTTPIYYVNDVPHIGHAYTTVAADVLSRYYKSQGKDVFFLTGTDEHGAKIAEAAQKAGKSPKEFVDALVPRFQKAWEKLNVKFDGFIRTTDKEHEKLVQDFIGKLQQKGFVEKRKYEGLYCVGCEKYLTEEDLVDGKCPDHKTTPVKQSEENYFFLLSKLSKELEAEIKSEKNIKIRPESRKNEVLGKIKAGLDDVSISRANVEWGVKFPGDESQTVYVWVDALLNYYSAAKNFNNGPSWPADLHLMAKDILWFHAVIWPAMLLAVGEELPKEVFAHGFFTIGGQKMSKSLGNVLDPVTLVDKYGADAVRYALLREFPFGEDGDISEEKIAQRYEKELAGGLGNLLQRTLTMINKYDVKIRPLDVDIFDGAKAFSSKVESLEFMEALGMIKRMIVDVGNERIDEERPWELAKNGETEKLTDFLSEIYRILRDTASHIAPFMPQTAEKMQKQLETLKPEPLFPRIEEE